MEDASLVSLIDGVISADVVWRATAYVVVAKYKSRPRGRRRKLVLFDRIHLQKSVSH